MKTKQQVSWIEFFGWLGLAIVFWVLCHWVLPQRGWEQVVTKYVYMALFFVAGQRSSRLF